MSDYSHKLTAAVSDSHSLLLSTSLGLRLLYDMAGRRFVFLTPCCGARYRQGKLTFRRCPECHEVLKLEQRHSLVYRPEAAAEQELPATHPFRRSVPPPPPADETAVGAWVESALPPLEAVLVGPSLAVALSAFAEAWAALESSGPLTDERVDAFVASYRGEF